MNWHHIGNPEGRVDINYKIVWRRDHDDGRTSAEPKSVCNETIIANRDLMGMVVQWRCLSGNCGLLERFGSMQYFCTSFSLENNWSMGTNTIRFDFPISSDRVFTIGNDPSNIQGCCWIGSLKNTVGLKFIRFFTEINLTLRPSTAAVNPNEINTSPSTDIPIWHGRVGCEQHLIIPYADPDFDSVRCRWAESNSDQFKDECGAVCHALDKAPFIAYLNESTCEIVWTPPDRGEGNYGGAVVLEDYLPDNPDNFMSRVPLQFVIKVSNAELPCEDKPVFVNTALHPHCFAIPENGTFTLTVTVKHVLPHHSVSFLVTSRPQGLAASDLVDVIGKPGFKQATLTWKPSSDQFGQPFFVCFLAVDDVGGASDSQCLTLLAGKPFPRVDLGSQFPKDDLLFTPSSETAQISFSMKVRHPTTPRYIKIFNSSNDTLVEMIDTSSSNQVSISADGLTASFTFKKPYLRNTTHYILMERGAFVGANINCAGGGPVTDGILNKGDWTFTTSSCINDLDCHADAQCTSGTCVCNTGFTGDGIQCKRVFQQCESHSCLNGGTCLEISDDIDTFCLCSWGFTGKTCDQELAITVPAFGHPYESYLQVNGDVRDVTDQGVAIVMKASSPNGLVFLMSSEANASNDLVALHLTEGHLDFRINHGNDRVKIVSPDAIPSCAWITVYLRYSGELHVDGSLVAASDSPGVPDDIQHRNTFLGGVPNPEPFSAATDGPFTGFVGCIRALSIGGKELSLENDIISSQSVGQCSDDPCSNQPCANGGLCQDMGPLSTDFSCTCQVPFTGVTCEIFNPCISDPCLNGGLCQLDKASTAGYRCICTALFIGAQCEIPSGKSSNPSLSYFVDSSTVWLFNSIGVREETSISLFVKPSVNRVTGFIACLGEANRDFLAVIADDGFVKVSMDLGGLNPLTLTSRQRLIAGQYTQIDVQRTGQDVQLTVSDRFVFESTDTSFAELDVGNMMYVGGVPASLLSISQKSSVGVSSGFNGCISNVTINQQTFQIADLFFSSNVAECDLDLCNHLSPCQNGGTCSASGNSLICKCAEQYRGVTCQQFFDPCSNIDCQEGSTCLETRDDAVCVCPLGKSGKLCNEDSLIQTPKFSSSLKSFMAYHPLPVTVAHSTLVSIIFKPQENSGLLIYSHQSTDGFPAEDFLSLSLNDGFVEFRYNLGTGTVVIRSSNRVALNQWHNVTAARTDRDWSLVVDNKSPVNGFSPGRLNQLDLVSDLFVGGVDVLSQVSSDAGLSSGFSGCISDLAINEDEYNLSFDGQQGRGITDCQDHPCNALICQNGGTCSNLKSHSNYQCVCPDESVDEFCQTTNPCLDNNGGCHTSSNCVFNSEIEILNCQCPFTPDPRTGAFCDQIDRVTVPKFKGSSFLQFSYSSVDPRTTSITFSVSAMDTHGLILYMPPTSDSADFLAVGIANGNLELRLDLGGGIMQLFSNINITGPSEAWHSVIITRNSLLATLTVDNKTVVAASPGTSNKLNVDDTFFLGGIPTEGGDLRAYDVLDGIYMKGFFGCISQLEVNGVSFDVEADALMGSDVASCDDSLGNLGNL